MSGPKNWEHARAACLVRDDYVCQMCGKENVNEADHIWPRAAGGPDVLENLQAACGPCNKAKGDRHDVNTATMQQLMWLVNYQLKRELDAITKAWEARHQIFRKFDTEMDTPLGLTLGAITRQRWSGRSYALLNVDQIAETSAAMRATAEETYQFHIAECDAADKYVEEMREAGIYRLADKAGFPSEPPTMSTAWDVFCDLTSRRPS